MAAGDHRAVGTATLPKSSPGELAEIEVTVGGMLTTDIIAITPAYTSKQTLRNAAEAFTFQVKKEAGKFTIYAEQEQTPEIKIDYIIRTSA